METSLVFFSPRFIVSLSLFLLSHPPLFSVLSSFFLFLFHNVKSIPLNSFSLTNSAKWTEFLTLIFDFQRGPSPYCVTVFMTEWRWAISRWATGTGLVGVNHLALPSRVAWGSVCHGVAPGRHVTVQPSEGFPGGTSGKESSGQCRRRGFHPWVRKNSWRRRRQPTPVFLPEKPHEQGSLVGYSLWGYKELDMTEWLSMHASSKVGRGGSHSENIFQ